MAADKNGNLYIADRGNYRIRKIDKASGNISTIAGSGAGNDGNGASALTAKFGSPLGLAVAENGDIYFVTSTHRIHRFNAASATVNTIAGSGRNSEGIEDEVGLMTGDGGPSLKAPLSSPSSIVLAPDDSIIIGDARNQLIRRLIPTGK